MSLRYLSENWVWYENNDFVSKKKKRKLKKKKIHEYEFFVQKILNKWPWYHAAFKFHQEQESDLSPSSFGDTYSEILYKGLL